MSLTVTHATVATAADDPSAEINKAEWNADHVITGGIVQSAAVTLTPGNLTGSVVLPAGAVLVDLPTDLTTAWDGGATLDIGDGDDPNGWTAALDLTIFPAGLSLSLQPISLSALGSGAAYVDGSNIGLLKARYPAGGTITATVTATNPTIGETHVVVLWTVPA